ncbi:MAG: hypothetical protein QOH04_1322 [Sphingomonadales bacterium]|jgi:hypothetical protein|nr:hypothetical protein [Sphingomonadales bacterium]
MRLVSGQTPLSHGERVRVRGSGAFALSAEPLTPTPLPQGDGIRGERR